MNESAPLWPGIRTLRGAEVARARANRIPGMWINYVPTVAEQVALMVGLSEELAKKYPWMDPDDLGENDPWVRSDWRRGSARIPHPASYAPGIVMPDEWFRGPEADRKLQERERARGDDCSGPPGPNRTVSRLAGNNMAGHPGRDEARTLGARWQTGRLSRREVHLTRTLLHEARTGAWIAILDDLDWTIREGAALARAVGTWNPDVVHWLNHYARRPDGWELPVRAETCKEIARRCWRQEERALAAMSEEDALDIRPPATEARWALHRHEGKAGVSATG